MLPGNFSVAKLHWNCLDLLILFKPKYYEKQNENSVGYVYDDLWIAVFCTRNRTRTPKNYLSLYSFIELQSKWF